MAKNKVKAELQGEKRALSLFSPQGHIPNLGDAELLEQTCGVRVARDKPPVHQSWGVLVRDPPKSWNPKALPPVLGGTGTSWEGEKHNCPYEVTRLPACGCAVCILTVCVV